MINVYFKGIITLKPFTYLELKNVNAYYGEALISTYQDEKELKGLDCILINLYLMMLLYLKK